MSAHLSIYLENRSRYEDHEALFTDGSKDEERAGAAVHTNAKTYFCRLPDGGTVFSTELKALLLAPWLPYKEYKLTNMILRPDWHTFVL